VANSLFVEIEEGMLFGPSARRVAISSTVDDIDISCFTNCELIEFFELTQK
jgi:hypothetical protein